MAASSGSGNNNSGSNNGSGSGSGSGWPSGTGISESDCMPEYVYHFLTSTGVSVKNVWVCGLGYITVDPVEIWGSASGSASGSEGNIIGYLSTNEQEQTTLSVWIPAGVKAVKFSCWGNGALTPVFNCATDVFGGLNSKTGVGIKFIWKEIVVPVAANNTTGKISFQTSDSNGGKAQYSFVY